VQNHPRRPARVALPHLWLWVAVGAVQVRCDGRGVPRVRGETAAGAVGRGGPLHLGQAQPEHLRPGGGGWGDEDYA
jgi:hypothetical protein